MIRIFVNLKRFDVPRRLGGVCPSDRPGEWISSVVARSAGLGLGSSHDLTVAFFVPEALLIPAIEALAALPADHRTGLEIGCQGVHWEDIEPGGNFGAFTTSLPASAAANLGCTWAIVGHSEERRDKLAVLDRFMAGAAGSPDARTAVDRLVGDEVARALEVGMKVVLCIGESVDQRSDISAVLGGQLAEGLARVGEASTNGRVVIGYEPIWAIGPGRTPPEADEIGSTAALIKQLTVEHLGFPIPVVYGGGLKVENARGIGAQADVDGGLVALTRFTGENGFDPDGLGDIVAEYRAGCGR